MFTNYKLFIGKKYLFFSDKKYFFIKYNGGSILATELLVTHKMKIISTFFKQISSSFSSCVFYAMDYLPPVVLNTALEFILNAFGLIVFQIATKINN